MKTMSFILGVVFLVGCGSGSQETDFHELTHFSHASKHDAATKTVGMYVVQTNKSGMLKIAGVVYVNEIGPGMIQSKDGISLAKRRSDDPRGHIFKEGEIDVFDENDGLICSIPSKDFLEILFAGGDIGDGVSAYIQGHKK